VTERRLDTPNDSHTPGPWNWEADPVKDDPTGRVRYQVTTTGKTITRVYYSSYEGGPTNAEADAKLIAAAPDLLAACEKFVEMFGPIELPDTEGATWLANVRAAIAKARGFSPSTGNSQ
jgi:hypothetical protein